LVLIVLALGWHWGVMGIGIESFGIALYWVLSALVLTVIGIESIGLGQESIGIDCCFFY
jgi:hypothetical protein